MAYEILRPAPVVSAGIVLTVGLLVPGVIFPQTPDPAKPSDSRKQALIRFFEKNESKLVQFADEFLQAADRHKLDWRLLPSLAMVESSGGKYYQFGNIFGWDSGRTRFSSIEDCIHHVAGRLAESPIYKGKSIQVMLTIYNPARKDYATRVTAVMRDLAPDQLALRVGVQ
jgi:hypothetical protein